MTERGENGDNRICARYLTGGGGCGQSPKCIKVEEFARVRLANDRVVYVFNASRQVVQSDLDRNNWQPYEGIFVFDTVQVREDGVPRISGFSLIRPEDVVELL